MGKLATVVVLTTKPSTSIGGGSSLAHLVIEEMDIKGILTLLKINRGDYSIVQVSVDANSEAVNKTVKELIIPASSVLIAISRGKETIIPRGDTTIHEGDNILALADRGAQVRINELFGYHK